ncbi:hypothetical protein BDR05DRAFT_1000291 [Suillus weaverae]|nr:hypothetical protein BDR05DRAFT_1000291 [Suillus weaverae]
MSIAFHLPSSNNLSVQSYDSMPTTHPSASAGSAALPSSLMDNIALARFSDDDAIQESKAHALWILPSGCNEQPVKRKMEFDDSAISWKRQILESFSADGICHLLATPTKLTCCNTDLSPTAKRLYREASDVFLKCKADAQLHLFMIKCVKSHKQPNVKTFIFSLPMEILIVIASLLGAGDLRTLTQVSSLLREIAGPLFFTNRNFPTSSNDLFTLHVNSPNFDVLTIWRRTDTFHPPCMMLCWIEADVRLAQLSAFSHFLQSVPCKSI